MKDRSLRALVVGAGLGGRAVAAFLRQSGYGVTLTSPIATEVDGGVNVAGNGVRVLSALGREGLCSGGIALSRDVTFDRHGQPVSEDDHAAELARGAGPLSFRRAALVAALRDAADRVVERLGTTIRALTATPDGVRVVDDAGDAVYDLVVVADGSRSVVRGLAFPDAKPSETPWSIVKVTARAADDTVAARVLGDGVTLVHAPIGGGERAVSFVLATPTGDVDLDAVGRAVGPAGAQLLAAMVPGTMTVEKVDDGLRDRWTTDRVVLVGGAAHALHPLLGQGPAMVIEDARALQVSLDRADTVAEALAAFEAMRRPRVAAVHALSWEISTAAARRSGFAASFRGALHKVVPSLSPEHKLHVRLSSAVELSALLSHRPDLAKLTPEARDVLRFLVKIGQVDGLFDEVERAFVAASMHETGHFATPAEVADVENETRARRVVEIVRPFKDRPVEFRERLLETGVFLAAASGRVAGDEHKALRDAGHELGISRDKLDALITKAIEARA